MKKLEELELNNTILEVYFTEDGIEYMQEVEIVDEKLMTSTVAYNFDAARKSFKDFGFDSSDAIDIALSMIEKHLCVLFFKGEPMIL